MGLFKTEGTILDKSFRAQHPSWKKQLLLFFVLMMVLLFCLQVVAEYLERKQVVEAGAERKNDFTISAAPGTDMTDAIEKFKTLAGHCPGLFKYKTDIEKVEYLNRSHADFLVTVVGKPSVLPAQSYGMGHTCHFSVDESKATVSKRPCAWLCTGEDMTGIDGENHSYAKGKLIGPLQRPWANLREAIATTRLNMTDIQGADLSVGAAKLALWSAANLRWSELQEIPAGKYAMVMKDPDTQRGSRICTSGQIIEIAVDRTVSPKIFLGGMFDDSGRLYRFIAVGSTGEIVAESRAKFCGIVTGQQHYENSAGGVAHSVHLVGMFDLPENRAR